MLKEYHLSKPFITNQEKRAVTEVLNSGQLSLGSKYKKFEKMFSKKIGTKYACCVSSGTAGLHLAMIATGIKQGDEVITTPFSFIASANCILYVGAKPVFCDIDPLTYNIDPKEIEDKITKKTKAILVVHIFGQSSDMTPIMKLAKRYKLKVIEDACESIDATYKGKKVGTFGELGVFAFYPNKQMTTGEGGMIVTNNKKIYQLCCSLRNQGRAESMDWLDHKYLGYNYRIDEMSAAIGIAQLKKLNFLIKQRRTIANYYSHFLKKYSKDIQVPFIHKHNTHTWFVYVIKLLNTKINRDKLILQLKKQGIHTKAYLPSIHLFEFYQKKYNYKKGIFPISENTSRYSLALPFYIGLSKSDVKFIINKLIKAIKYA
ncbi:MAG: DegT/DnrJ/EryC1/StrS family aminotransferase [Patescibacteria group bacterium]|nr:DegT/DnrJ/EryC1/StrS family aminotransferase [Patescibacteria group bacterium]MDD5715140.1 DegT/DnrJ/EryC1/StrS family aminotransferase [Patescibacteria group bacterium]